MLNNPEVESLISDDAINARKNAATNPTDVGLLLQNLGTDEVTIELGALTAAEISSRTNEIKQALLSLIHSPTKRLIIHGDAMTEDQARFILNYLQEPESALFAVEITLPAHLEQNKIQLELDNLISNHSLEKNKKQITGALPSAELDPQIIQEAPKGRIRPKKVKPKIEITLYEESTHESPKAEETVVKTKTPPPTLVEPPKLERSPMAARIINELLSQDIFKAEKNIWEQITNRSDAQVFRKTFPKARTARTEDHPIYYLVRNNEALKNKLNHWTETLKLGIEQYDALLDVVGQYGPEGLECLFKTWEYDSDPYKTAAFQESHALLLKYMPSYLPVIQDSAFNETISKIANLNAEKRSWWVALIKNHVDITKGYSDLPYLFKVFTEATVAIEEMGLPFYNINTIQYKKNLPTTLSHMIALLQKCPPQDREVQWKCISNVDVSEQADVHFIIPEMKLGEQHPDLAEMKTIIERTPESAPERIKPAFYRFLAQQKQHLPLKQYEQILNEILSNTVLTNQNKLRMVYVLAKATSTDKDTPLDVENVYKEWNIFQVRTLELAYMERIKANRSGLARFALTQGIESEGGYPEVRNTILKPIMDMPLVPPMSYLNKLLTLSEYQFLSPALSLLDMKSVQKDMLVKMDKAAALYGDYPDAMSKAIRLIKTETVKANAQGQFFPETKDVTLLEQFVSSSTTLIDKKHNTLSKEEHNPRQVLLPLLTTFHLEYESKDKLEQLIERYKERVTGIKKPNYKDIIQDLLPYGLSLLQLIKDRAQPNRLDLNTLDKIQNELLDILCTPQPVSKKQIREWLHQRYGKHFDGNILLDIKDEVNFDVLFDSLDCHHKETRRAIETLASYFDEDEEKGYHTQLVTDLVALTNQLIPEQNAKFFEYCLDALKTDGILSRNKQDRPPTYIQQFRTLVQTLTSNKNIAALEQYLIIARERALHGGTDRNNLAKCDYLINILFPALLSKNIERKEAFNFAANLVCQSPLQALQSAHEQVSFAATIDPTSSELNDLEKQIQHFNTDDKTLHGLLEIRNKIEALIALAPNDTNYFKQCRKIRDLIDKINSAAEERTAEHNSRNLLVKAWRFVTNFGSYSPSIMKDEFSSLDSEGLSTLAADTQNDVKQLRLKMNTRFQDVVTHLHDKKEELISKYGNITIRANDFIAKALSLSPNDISKNHNEICQLIDDLILLDDQNLVLSLMYHYVGGLPGRGVKDLVALFNTPDYQSLNNTIKKDFINAVISQMNNNVKCGKEEINAFLSFICANKEQQVVIDCLHDFYQQAPYPPLEKFMSWTQNSTNREDLNRTYEQFDKNPCALPNGHDGREKENGFKLGEAKRIVAKMPEVQEIFTQEYLLDIESQSEKAKTLSTESILQQLKDYKNTSHANHIELVMLAAELLHRCKGRTPEFVGDVQIPGRSFELNTTQIMAILSMLETGRKVTAEIGTGEGKTRILMLINACQFLKGNTVDFLTSNLALAERDYLESLPFFKSLGAEVNFITASSKIEDYKIGGINVSDPANLFLFRKKGHMQNKANQVIDPNKEKRTLTLDEADVTFFDVSNTKYNFASKTPKINIKLVPFFPLLMEFFAQGETEKTYLENKKRCTEQLLDFIEARNPDLFNIVKTFKVEQLEKWQDAAYSARHLEYNIDYSVVSEATISTDLGSKKVAAAMCLIGGRVNENARFSEGVHACLHAELNRLMKAPDSEVINPYLKEILEKCKSKGRQFDIAPERQIASTTSANTMLKDYDRGNLMAVTGTVGTELEQREAKTYFKTKFIYVPRHKGLHRYDRPIIICNNDKNCIDTFVTSILEARAKNEPTLIICKDDNQSRELYDALQRRLESNKDKNGLPKITRIHAATDYEDGISEAEYIKNEAGKPGQVTISTEMQGRGVDIIPGPAGLRVLHAYLPKDERDYIQGVGRSGRFGQIGTTQMILTVDSLKQDFGIDYLNTDFYLNPEAFIRRLQIFSTITKKLHRLFYKGFDDLLGAYTKKYEKLLLEDEESAESWSQFLEQISLSQENAQQAIEAQIQQKEPNISEIEEKLAEHCQKATELWNKFTESLPEAKRALLGNNQPPEMKKPKELEAWLKTMKELQEKNMHQVEVIEKRTVKIHERYNAANDGRVSILKYPAAFIPNLTAWWKGQGKLFPNLQSWWKGDLGFRDMFAFSRNFQAWWRGEGILFPNLQAWLSGNLSFRNMISQWPIFRYFITPVEETHEVKITIPSTYAYFYKHPEFIDEEEAENDALVDPKLIAEESSEKDSLVDREPKHHQSLFANTDKVKAGTDENRSEIENLNDTSAPQK
ncbi:preprotein translocase subunit SecA [Legionella fallonii]|uniref:SecA domain-containing protein n=1 Tax=Legionella fallonii LLAP-10 TaxID=1212491 RepID=A0A098FZL2_9GAMM|nr:hypothetical protein [Legionella fallonii]CEG55673.1 SecA domain-containing protein [Legionella fallonii LLAP-10]